MTEIIEPLVKQFVLLATLRPNLALAVLLVAVWIASKVYRHRAKNGRARSYSFWEFYRHPWEVIEITVILTLEGMILYNLFMGG